MAANSFGSGALKFKPILFGLFGVALSVWLLRNYGFSRIGELFVRAGWLGISAVIAFHGIQMLCSALGWREIADQPAASQPTREYFVLRWIREAVNNLLPLAQIGGEVVAFRLMSQRGAKLASAIAGTTADLTMEVVSQIVFTLIGVGLLLLSGQNDNLAEGVIGGTVLAALFMVGAFFALRFGAARLIEKGLMRLGPMLGWSGAGKVAGLHEALLVCYRNPAKVASSFLWHLISWLLGGAEVCLALYVLGHGVNASTGLVIESLGQVAKALGFAIPGALGIQEGGYIIVCALALALSLTKRLREVALGIPGLLFCQRWENRLRGAESIKEIVL